MLADGASYTAITAAVGCYPAYIARWKQRFETARLAGLEARYRASRPRVRTPALEARILAKTQQPAARWEHPLDDAQAGQRDGGQPHAGRAGLAARRAAAASP